MSAPRCSALMCSDHVTQELIEYAPRHMICTPFVLLGSSISEAVHCLADDWAVKLSGITLYAGCDMWTCGQTSLGKVASG